jgi:hypothetical protein
VANGIKLRRGIKTALATTIADGELVFATDAGEIGYKSGTEEYFIDLVGLDESIQSLVSGLSTTNGTVSNLDSFTSDLSDEISILQDKFINLGGDAIPISININDFSILSTASNTNTIAIDLATINPAAWVYLDNAYTYHAMAAFLVPDGPTEVGSSYVDEYGVANVTYFPRCRFNSGLVRVNDDGYGNLEAVGISNETSTDSGSIKLEVVNDGYGTRTVSIYMTFNSQYISDLIYGFIRFNAYLQNPFVDDANTIKLFVPKTEISLRYFSD